MIHLPTLDMVCMQIDFSFTPPAGGLICGNVLIDYMSVITNLKGKDLILFPPLHPDILDESGGTVNEMLAEYFSTNTDGQRGECNSNR